MALGVKAAPYPGYAQPLEQRMADAGPIWDRIVAKYGLQPNEVDRLASWWHTDAALGRTLETLTDMTKSRRLGFRDIQVTEDSFTDLFDRLGREKIIPGLPMPNTTRYNIDPAADNTSRLLKKARCSRNVSEQNRVETGSIMNQNRSDFPFSTTC